MKTRECNITNSGWQARNILDCGGKRSATPLSNAAGAVVKLRRRFALPEQSKTWRQLVAFLLFTTLPLVSTFAQSYSIDWYKVAGGGGTSTGGVYAVSGTIGQHDAGGPMTGGNYSLNGGFWALISVVQMPGAPTLFISHSGNSVIVYWQNTGSWTLQQNGNPANLSGWSINSSWITSNGTNYLTLPSPAGNSFFRLHQ